MKLVKLFVASSVMLFTSSVLANYLALIDKGFILLGSSTDVGHLSATDVNTVPIITSKKMLKKKVMKKKVTSRRSDRDTKVYSRHH